MCMRWIVFSFVVLQNINVFFKKQPSAKTYLAKNKLYFGSVDLT